AIAGGDDVEVVLLQHVFQLFGLCAAVLDDEDFQAAPARFGFHILVTMAVNALAIPSGGNTSLVAPILMACPGMPWTTELSSSWTMVKAPASFNPFSSSAPSIPIPVSRTPTELGPKTALTERKRNDAEGRMPFSRSLLARRI